jgi:hypothetical protein
MPALPRKRTFKMSAQETDDSLILSAGRRLVKITGGALAIVGWLLLT